MAVKVGCGVPVTSVSSGGLAVDPKTSGVISTLTGRSLSGALCAGEMMGGLFCENYPGGSGPTSGAVFGRKGYPLQMFRETRKGGLGIRMKGIVPRLLMSLRFC